MTTATGNSTITRQPGRCGGSACIRQTRYTVWGLVELWRLGMADAEILSAHPELSAADLDAARFYAAEHSDEIERDLWANEAAMLDPNRQTIPKTFLERGRRLGLSEETIRNAFEPALAEE